MRSINYQYIISEQGLPCSLIFYTPSILYLDMSLAYFNYSVFALPVLCIIAMLVLGDEVLEQRNKRLNFGIFFVSYKIQVL